MAPNIPDGFPASRSRVLCSETARTTHNRLCGRASHPFRSFLPIVAVGGLALLYFFFFPSEAHRYTADSRGGDRVSRSFVQARELPRRPPPPAAISFLTHPGFSTGSKLTITRQLTIPCTRTFVHTPYLPLSFPLYFLSFCTKATRHTVSRLPFSLSLSLSVYRSIDRSSNNRVQCIV